MTNWPRDSIYSTPYGPVEVTGGLLFPPWQWEDAKACAERIQANGHDAVQHLFSGDLGILVGILK